MNRRNLLIGAALATIAPSIARTQEARKTSIFRSDSPVEILHHYVAVLRALPESKRHNADMAELAARDPVAMWIAVDALVPEGTDVDTPARVASTIAVAERLWETISDQDREHIQALLEAAEQNRLDGHAAAMALAETRGSWFNPDRFFDQLEEVSRNFPPRHAESDFDAWAAWRVPISSLSFSMGYEGHMPASPDEDADAATVTPYLFDTRKGLAEHLARRFQASPIADSLLLAWLYAPNFEVYLAYGDLPASLPDAVAAASPRLAAIYRSVNARQMEEFAAREEEMMQ